MDRKFNRAVILGCACVITSRLTCEQYEMYSRYHPEALKMADEDGNVIFTVEIDQDGPGSILPDKACFSRTKTPDGKATITVVIDPEIEEKVKVITERFGSALLHLEELEEHLLEKAGELEEEVRKVEGMVLSAERSIYG